MKTLAESVKYEDSDDVWSLPPLPAVDACLPPLEISENLEDGPEPEDDREPGRGGGGQWSWTTDPVARTWHDCSACRGIIGRGDPYRRVAVPMHTHWIVTKECWTCCPAPR